MDHRAACVVSVAAQAAAEIGSERAARESLVTGTAVSGLLPIDAVLRKEFG